MSSSCLFASTKSTQHRWAMSSELSSAWRKWRCPSASAPGATSKEINTTIINQNQTTPRPRRNQWNDQMHEIWECVNTEFITNRWKHHRSKMPPKCVRPKWDFRFAQLFCHYYVYADILSVLTICNDACIETNKPLPGTGPLIACMVAFSLHTSININQLFCRWCYEAASAECI